MTRHRARHDHQLDAVAAATIGLAIAVMVIVGWIVSLFARPKTAVSEPLRSVPLPPPQPKPEAPITPQIRGGRMAFKSVEEFETWKRQARQRV
jgi:hypothetical protein